jgi:hypothetical protein
MMIEALRQLWALTGLKRESKVLEIVRREAIGAGGSHLRARTPVGGIVQWPAGIGVVVGE